MYVFLIAVLLNINYYYNIAELSKETAEQKKYKGGTCKYKKSIFRAPDFIDYIQTDERLLF